MNNPINKSFGESTQAVVNACLMNGATIRKPKRYYKETLQADGSMRVVVGQKGFWTKDLPLSQRLRDFSANHRVGWDSGITSLKGPEGNMTITIPAD